MKKIICVLMAVMALGCFAGCVDHNDGVCDECGTNKGVIQYDEDNELCPACAAKKAIDKVNSAINDK